MKVFNKFIKLFKTNTEFRSVFLVVFIFLVEALLQWTVFSLIFAALFTALIIIYTYLSFVHEDLKREMLCLKNDLGEVNFMYFSKKWLKPVLPYREKLTDEESKFLETYFIHYSFSTSYDSLNRIYLGNGVDVGGRYFVTKESLKEMMNIHKLITENN